MTFTLKKQHTSCISTFLVLEHTSFYLQNVAHNCLLGLELHKINMSALWLLIIFKWWLLKILSMRVYVTSLFCIFSSLMVLPSFIQVICVLVLDLHFFDAGPWRLGQGAYRSTLSAWGKEMWVTPIQRLSANSRLVTCNPETCDLREENRVVGGCDLQTELPYITCLALLKQHMPTTFMKSILPFHLKYNNFFGKQTLSKTWHFFDQSRFL